MKKFLALAALAVASTSAAWAANPDFKLINRTGYAINEVYISPSKQDTWGKDRMGEYQLLNNQSKQMRFGETKHCVFDIKVVFTDDESEVVWEDINLCEHTKITLKYNSKTEVATAEME